MKLRITAFWNKLIHFASQDRLLIGASLFRIVAGLTILYQYLINYYNRHYLFGPDAAWSFQTFREHIARESFSLYAFSSSLFWFELVFHLGIIITTLWLIGWRTRLMTVLTFIFFWSLHERTPLLWDGGDNLMYLAFVYAMFANLGAYFSFDAERLQKARERGGAGQQVLSIFHNAAILAFAIQLCLLYGVSGLNKVQGEMWQNGTALYYIMRIDEYSWPGVSELIYQNAFLVTAGTYATVAFQVAFPFLFVMNRYTRWVALLGAFGFHLGIAAFMGLITFSAFMISVELALIPDSEYRSIKQRIDRWQQNLVSRFTQWQHQLRRSPRLAPLRIQVLYDGWCPFCQKSIARLQRLDTLQTLDLISFREPGVLSQFGIASERAEARMQVCTNDKTLEGIDAVTCIAARLPLLWPVLPLLWIPQQLGLGQRVYDWFASRRTIIPTGCDTHCELQSTNQHQSTASPHS